MERTTYIYRLHTEDVGDNSVEQQVAVYFDAFTILRGTGYWEGKAERTMIVEIVTDQPFMMRTLRRIAKALNRMNKQECCMITSQEITMTLEEGRP